jgi:hypothetical protein
MLGGRVSKALALHHAVPDFLQTQVEQSGSLVKGFRMEP